MSLPRCPSKKKNLIFFSPTSRPPKRSLRKQGNRRVRKKKKFPLPTLGVEPRTCTGVCAYYLTLGAHIGTMQYAPTLPYPTLGRSPPPRGWSPIIVDQLSGSTMKLLSSGMPEDNNCCGVSASPTEQRWACRTLPYPIIVDQLSGSTMKLLSSGMPEDNNCGSGSAGPIEPP